MKRHIVTKLICALLSGSLLLSGIPAEAASKKQKAINAYRAFLSAPTIEWGGSGGEQLSTSGCKFALVYVDKNKVPELMIDALGAGNGHVEAKPKSEKQSLTIGWLHWSEKNR